VFYDQSCECEPVSHLLSSNYIIGQQEDGCPIKLTLANHKVFEGKIYCAKHLPNKQKATTKVAQPDSVMTQHALNAPKQANEGLATVHKGIVA
jgi:hypothetical protein